MPASGVPTGSGLELTGVTKRFGLVTALDGVDVAVDRGELVGVVGGPGSGRSTLLRAALGVLAPDAGSATWDGAPLTAAARHSFGYLPQRPALPPALTVLDHLVHLGELHGLPVNDAHRAAETWIARLGLRAARDTRLRALPAGARAGVRLAAALVHDPALVVLDDPFTGLDPAEVLRERARAGAAVLLTGDRLDLVERLCDRVVVLRAGRVAAQGAVERLRAAAGVRLVVDAPAAGPGWADGVPGARVVEVSGPRTVLALGEGVDEQPVLAAALATGPVREFRVLRPSLVDVYRDAVGA